MRWPFTRSDLVFFIFMLLLVGDLIMTWNRYKTCYAPTHLFWVITYSTFSLLRIFVTLMAAPDLPRRLKKFLMFIFHFILNPAFIYLPIQGTIWQVQNIVSTPDCFPTKTISYVVWFWVVSLLFIGGFMTFFTIIRIKTWYRMYEFKRRMRLLAARIGNEDAAILSEMLLGDQEFNDRMGLFGQDIERIGTTTYSSSVADMIRFNYQESCPICFDEYQVGTEIMRLPICHHIYHPQCIKGWLLKSPLCPMCRSNVRTNLYNEIMREHNINPQTDLPENQA